jgi:hypothetical protein
MTVAELLALAGRDPAACRHWMETASVAQWRALPVMNSAVGPVVPVTDAQGPRLLALPPLPNLLLALDR